MPTTLDRAPQSIKDLIPSCIQSARGGVRLGAQFLHAAPPLEVWIQPKLNCRLYYSESVIESASMSESSRGVQRRYMRQRVKLKLLGAAMQ
ncbi:MAG: hypothetical protein ACREYE_06480 [Gammaproteobacteria bacterium]